MDPTLSRLTEYEHNNSINRKKSLSCSYLGIGVLCFTLFAATSIILLVNDNLVLALTRGTIYDDVLIIGMANNSKSNGTDQMAVTEAEQTAIGESQNTTNEFIYGDYGNDEIQGSSRSDQLSGGPGSDVIYGNDGGIISKED